MKKVLAVLIIIIVVYLGFQLFGNKNNNGPKIEDYKLDQNYMFSFKFNDNSIVNVVDKTYYVYSNEKAVYEKITRDRSGNIIKKEYEDVVITDPDFSINDIFVSLRIDSVDLQNVFSYELYRNDTGKSYMLASNDEIAQYIIKALNAESRK